MWLQPPCAKVYTRMRMTPLKIPAALRALPHPGQPYSVVTLYDSKGELLHRAREGRFATDSAPRVRLHLAPNLHMMDQKGRRYRAVNPPPYTEEEQHPHYQGVTVWEHLPSAADSDANRSVRPISRYGVRANNMARALSANRISDLRPHAPSALTSRPPRGQQAVLEEAATRSTDPQVVKMGKRPQTPTNGALYRHTARPRMHDEHQEAPSSDSSTPPGGKRTRIPDLNLPASPE